MHAAFSGRGLASDGISSTEHSDYVWSSRQSVSGVCKPIFSAGDAGTIQDVVFGSELPEPVRQQLGDHLEEPRGRAGSH